MALQGDKFQCVSVNRLPPCHLTRDPGHLVHLPSSARWFVPIGSASVPCWAAVGRLGVLDPMSMGIDYHCLRIQDSDSSSVPSQLPSSVIRSGVHSVQFVSPDKSGRLLGVQPLSFLSPGIYLGTYAQGYAQDYAQRLYVHTYLITGHAAWYVAEDLGCLSQMLLPRAKFPERERDAGALVAL